jgi:hypothetical protein
MSAKLSPIPDDVIEVWNRYNEVAKRFTGGDGVIFPWPPSWNDITTLLHYIKALRAKLAEPEQEPTTKPGWNAALRGPQAERRPDGTLYSERPRETEQERKRRTNEDGHAPNCDYLSPVWGCDGCNCHVRLRGEDSRTLSRNPITILADLIEADDTTRDALEQAARYCDELVPKDHNA